MQPYIWGILMLTGAHVVICSKDAEADRKFFADILGFGSVDAGHGWLIFELLAAEVAFIRTTKTTGMRCFSCATT